MGFLKYEKTLVKFFKKIFKFSFLILKLTSISFEVIRGLHFFESLFTLHLIQILNCQ